MVYRSTQLQQMSSIMPSLYTYVCQPWVMSDLAVIPQTDSSPALTTMANSHKFDDVAHFGIRLGIGNCHYTTRLLDHVIIT